MIMKKLLSGLINYGRSLFQGDQIKQLVSLVVVGLLVLTSTVGAVQTDSNRQPLGQKIRDVLPKENVSERPKTNGEFLEEAEGDVPLDERLHNITRDSAEAIRDFGSMYVQNAKDAASTLKGEK
jgi:hypothetical protein